MLRRLLLASASLLAPAAAFGQASPQAPNQVYATPPSGAPGNLIIRPLVAADLVAANSYGLVGDGTTNNNAALQAALTAIASGGSIKLPCGVFKITTAMVVTVAAGAHIDVGGSGLGCTVIQQAAAAHGFSVTYGSAVSSVSFHDFTLTTTNPGGFTALNMIGTGNAATDGDANNLFRNMMVRGDDYPSSNTDYWSVGINLNDVSQTQADNVTIYGSGSNAGVGIAMNGNSALAYSYVLNVSNSFFGLGFAGIYLQNFWQGLSVVNTNFGGGSGIDQVAGATGIPAQILVSNSQFNCSGVAINLQSTVLAASISNSLFLLASNSAYAVGISAAQTGFKFYGNTVNGEGNLGFGVSIAAAVASGHIFHNTFNAVNTAITTGAAAYSLSIDKNKFLGGTIPYSINTGGSGIIIDDTNNPHTVATLPTASAAINGSQAIATDVSTPTYGGSLTGGGTGYVRAIVSGGAWKSQ